MCLLFFLSLRCDVQRLDAGAESKGAMEGKGTEQMLFFSCGSFSMAEARHQSEPGGTVFVLTLSAHYVTKGIEMLDQLLLT
jgi:hypothetical protein